MDILLLGRESYQYDLNSCLDDLPNQMEHINFLKPQLFLDDVVPNSKQPVSPNHGQSKLLFP